MSMWRCPHCGTPQAETARCWVCHRSSTTCSTCRNFRRSVAGTVGYCGLDRRRMPLSGVEHRGCWEARVAAGAEAPDPRTDPKPAYRDVDRRRDFVPVELLPSPITGLAAVESSALVSGGAIERDSVSGSAADAARSEPWRDRRTLFGEADR